MRRWILLCLLIGGLLTPGCEQPQRAPRPRPAATPRPSPGSVVIRGSSSADAATTPAPAPDPERSAAIERLERRLAEDPRDPTPDDALSAGLVGEQPLASGQALDAAEAPPEALAEELDLLEAELDRGAGQGSAPVLRLEELVALLGARDRSLREQVLAVRDAERQQLDALDAEVAQILREEREQDEAAYLALKRRGVLPFEARAQVEQQRAARPRPTREPERREVKARARQEERALQDERRALQRLRHRAQRLLRR